MGCLFCLHLDSYALQNIENPNYIPLDKTCLVSLLFSKHIFNEDNLAGPNTFGNILKKARLNAVMQTRDLAAIIGVTEAAV